MRISDWSSDVCSSDLLLVLAAPCLLKKVGGAVGDVQLDPAAVPVDRDRVAIEAEILPYVDELADDLILRLGADVEIAGVEPAADREAGDMLAGRAARVGGRSLAL